MVNHEQMTAGVEPTIAHLALSFITSLSQAELKFIMPDTTMGAQIAALTLMIGIRGQLFASLRSERLPRQVNRPRGIITIEGRGCGPLPRLADRPHSFLTIAGRGAERRCRLGQRWR
jgi:hypothetical protein